MAAQKPSQPPETGPRARELARKLRVDIISKAQPGQRLPSEVQLTKRFRCSNRTVRAALGILEAERLIVRKQGSGTYVTERMGRVTGTTGILLFQEPSAAFVLPYVCDEFRGIIGEASGPARQVQVLTGFSAKRARQGKDLFMGVDLSQADSLICIEVMDQNLLAALARRMPTVSVDAECYQEGVSSCCVDHEQSVSLAVQHLGRLGHRRIALVGNLDPRHEDVAIHARRRAFRKVLLERGFRHEPDWVVPIGKAEDGADLMRRWLREPREKRPTAMICVDYQWPVAQAAVSAGVKIPEQLSLMSLGNVNSWQSRVEHIEWVEPWLNLTDARERSVDLEYARTGQRSSPLEPRFAPLRDMVFAQVRLPFVEMGRWAMRELVERLNQAGREPRHVKLPGKIRPGNTAGPPSSV